MARFANNTKKSSPDCEQNSMQLARAFHPVAHPILLSALVSLPPVPLHRHPVCQGFNLPLVPARTATLITLVTVTVTAIARGTKIANETATASCETENGTHAIVTANAPPSKVVVTQSASRQSA